MNRDELTGVILAGGEGRRMGGADKGLQLLDGRPLVHWVLDRLRPQVGRVVISANRNLDRYRAFGTPVYADDNDDFAGPLAGIARLLQVCTTEFLVTTPCDTPEFPENLVQTLLARQQESGADAVVVHDGEQRQFLFALYRRELAAAARDAVVSGERAVWRWQEELNLVEARVDGGAGAFANLNTRADL